MLNPLEGLQGFERVDQIDRKRWSTVSALYLFEALPRDTHPAFLARGFGEFHLWARRHLAQADLKFEDFQRAWRILQYLMTRPLPNRAPQFLETL